MSLTLLSRRVASVLIATATLLGGAGAAPILAADPAMPLTLTFETISHPDQNHVHAVGGFTYGTFLLTATAEIGGTPVPIEVVGHSRYLDGTGPFIGSFTMTYPNGDELGLGFDAVVQPKGKGTAVTGSLQVIGGTGVLAGVTGSGTMVGGRTGPLGSPVAYEVVLDLAGLPDPATVAPTEVAVTTDPDAAALDLMTYYSDLLIAKDVPALDALIGEGFQIQRADGSHQAKDDYLAKLPNLKAYSFTDPVETRAGDLAVLRLTVASELEIDGQAYKPDPAPMLAVFEWDGSGWHLVAQGNFNLPQA